MDVNIENRDRLLITILQDGYCPYCSKGRFKNVLAHISKIHGIKAVELKDSLGLTRRHSFTSETTKHKQRESAKSTKRIKNLTIKGVTKKHSEIAKAKMSQTKKEMYQQGLLPHLKNIAHSGGKKSKRNKVVLKFYPDGSLIEYPSVTEAAKANKVTLTSITDACAGRSKTCAGGTWQYKERYMDKTLENVMTASEAARLWGKDASTVKKACQADKFTPDEVRKSGGTWLVTVAGMERVYGSRKL